MSLYFRQVHQYFQKSYVISDLQAKKTSILIWKQMLWLRNATEPHSLNRINNQSI